LSVYVSETPPPLIVSFTERLRLSACLAALVNLSLTVALPLLEAFAEPEATAFLPC